VRSHFEESAFRFLLFTVLILFWKDFFGCYTVFQKLYDPQKNTENNPHKQHHICNNFYFFFLQNAHLQENSLFVAFFLNFLLKKIIVLDYSSVSGGLETVCSANFMGTWMYYVYLISKQNAFQV
jgi:hypothetical protein